MSASFTVDLSMVKTMVPIDSFVEEEDVSVTIEVDPQKAEFLQYDVDSGLFSVSRGATSKDDVGEYTIKVKLVPFIDQQPEIVVLRSLTYTFTLIVNPLDVIIDDDTGQEKAPEGGFTWKRPENVISSKK